MTAVCGAADPMKPERKCTLAPHQDDQHRAGNMGWCGCRVCVESFKRRDYAGDSSISELTSWGWFDAEASA